MFFLESNAIGLRCLSEDDIKNGYGNWLNDDEVCQYNSHYRYPVTENQLSAYVKSVRDDSTFLVLAVEEKQHGIHIGNISLQQIDLINRQAEIALLFGEKEYWKKGYGAQAAYLLIAHAFQELGLNRIYFGTAENNIGMQKVGEKLNFVRNGVRRQALYKHGRFYDIYDYDLLREEWTQDED